MYFGAELIDARAAQGLEAVPVGLIQSAIGGSQIEAWMSNETLASCKSLSLTGGAVPEDRGRLYYGMVAPFANYSVAGWVWYQGENNVYGDMGNSAAGTGYGCALPAMVSLWRGVWRAPPSALFGVATLAAGGSEGPGWHMSGMRWSETANYGRWDNPALPNSFGAQVYDLGDPWAQVGDGNPRKLDPATGKVVGLRCCGDKGHWGNCSSPANGGACSDKFNCSLPELGPAGEDTGKYGDQCAPWDESEWAPKLRPLAKLVRANAPSSLPGNNFMGGIHPRLKRPVGRRLAYAAARMLKQQQRAVLGQSAADGVGADGAMTGPTIAGCTLAAGKFELTFNASLLGGEGLLLRSFDSNSSNWAPEPGWAGPGPIHDSLGLMVCARGSG
jgi:sialate O-acetylesterase